ncbi:MAG: PAS domain S-box protein [Calditrichaeota bacterium]|nr:MAG: PAS domain S-box protein [Calditrichota bacterium]
MKKKFFHSFKNLFSTVSDIEVKEKKKSIIVELILISSIVVCLTGIVIFFELSESLRLLANKFSLFNVDTLFFVLLFSLLGLSVFTFRRFNELVSFIKKSLQVEGALASTVNKYSLTQRQLEKQTDILNLFFKNTSDCIAILDTEFNYSEINDAFERMCKSDKEILVNSNHFELFDDDTKDLFQNVLETKSPFYAKARTFSFINQINKDKYYWDWSLLPIVNDDDEVKFLVLTLKNITKQKYSSEMFNYSNQKYLLQFEQSPVAIIEWNRSFEVINWNPQAENLFGYDNKEAVGKHAYDLIFPHNNKFVTNRLFKKMLDNHAGTEITLKNFDNQDNDLTCFWRFNPITDTNGSIHSIISVVENITEQVRGSEIASLKDKHTKSLLHLTKKLDLTESIEEIIDTTRREIQKIIGFKTAWLYTLDDTMEHGILEAHSSALNLNLPETFNKVKITGDKYFLSLMDKKHVDIIEDVQKDEYINRSLVKQSKVKTLAYIPLMLLGQRIGLLIANSFVNERDLPVSSYHKEYLKELGNLVAFAFNRVQIKASQKKSENALRESEELYRTLIDQSGDAIYLLRNGKYEILNKKFTEFFGLTLEDVNAPDFDLLKFVAPKSKSMMENRIRKVKAGEKVPLIYDFTALSADGSEIEIEASVNHLNIKNQITTQAILRDITKRKQSQKIQTALYMISETSNMNKNLTELLKEIHSILSSVMDVANFYVALYNPDTNKYSFPYFIDETEDVPEGEENLDNSLTDYIRKTETPLIFAAETFEEMKNDENFNLIGEIPKIWMGVPLKTPDGVIGVVAVQSYTDPKLYTEHDLEILSLISGQIALAIERKKADENTKRYNKFLKTVLDSFSNPLLVINTSDYSVEIANEAARNTGFSKKLSKYCYEIAHNSDCPCSDTVNDCPLRTVQTLKKPIKIEHHVTRKDGKNITYDVHAYPIFDEEGNVIQIIEYYIDITEHKIAQSKLSELAVFPEANPNIVLSLNKNLEILYMNTATTTILGDIGVTRDKFLTALPKNITAILKEIINEGYGMSDVQVNINGHTLSWYFHPVVGQDIVHCYAHDITEQMKQAEELMQLSTVASQSSNLIVITDLEGTIEYVNPYFTIVTGYEAKDVIGQKASILKTNREDKRVYKALWETITKGETWNGKMENRKKNGETYWEQKTISPIFNEKKEIINYVSVANDITKELVTQQKLVETEKLTAIGTLAAGVAHEFKNYLGGIIGNASFTLDELESEDGLSLAKETLESIISMGEKANDVAMSLLTFSKAKSEDRKVEDLPKLIEQSINLVSKELESLSIEIITHFDDVPNIEISRSKIQQLLLNLLINAKHAVGSNGVITVALLNKDSFVEIRVADSGGGIKKEHLDKIFDPFFSTKGVWGSDQVSGTGMGLSICKNIAQEHLGDLTCDTMEGIGTTFVLKLPISLHNIDENSFISKTNETNILLFTFDNTIMNMFYEEACRNHINIILLDDYTKFDSALAQKISYVICDAKFTAKMELYKLVDFCIQISIPYLMINCGTMEYQLADLYENSIVNFKEIPEFSSVITHIDKANNKVKI